MPKTSAQKDLEKHWAKQARETQKSAKGSSQSSKAIVRDKGAPSPRKGKSDDPAL